MAHQTHNIPWNTLASNFTFHDDIHKRSRGTDFFALNLPNQPKSLTYFAQRLSSIIREFSNTERAKYPARFDAPTEGKLFADELREKWPYARPGWPFYQYSVLTEENQNIEYWIRRNDKAGARRNYSFGAGLEEVVKMLLQEGMEEMETLLMLAHHPQVPIEASRHMRSDDQCGNQYGWDQVAECALQAYIFFNMLVAYQSSNSQPNRILKGGGYKELWSYKKMAERITAGWNPDAHTILHRKFLWETSTNTDGVEVVGGYEAFPPLERDDVLVDHERLCGYLKELFRLIVRYDVLAREIGVETDWQSQVTGTIVDLWWLNHEDETDENGQYTGNYRFV